jgi:hypothetical protein
VTTLVTRTRAVEVSPYLAIYLNDHLAGATGGEALADRAAHNAAGSRHAASLRSIADEIREDRSALIELMDLLNVRPSRLKPTLGLVAELLGRLKPNGHVLRPSPLTPFIELESLSLGVEGKLRLWRALSHIVDDQRLTTRLDELIDRGRAQRDTLERLRHELARDVLTGDRPSRHSNATVCDRPGLDGAWEVHRLNGLVPAGLTKRVHCNRGSTLLGDRPIAGFEVSGATLRYRWLPLRDELVPVGEDVWHGTAFLLGLRYGTFRLHRLRASRR